MQGFNIEGTKNRLGKILQIEGDDDRSVALDCSCENMSIIPIWQVQPFDQ